MACQVGETSQFEEVLAVGWLVDYFMLEDPGEVVGDEDGVQAGSERRIDVRSRTVANHPGGAGLAAMVGGEGAVGFVVLFGEDLDSGEVRGQAGAVEFPGLLFGVAFGDHDETVAGGQVGQGGCDAGEELDLLIGDGLSEAFDAAVFLVGEGHVGELLETSDERAAKAVEAIAVGADGGVLDAIEVLADLFGGVDTVVQVGDEAGDGLLEVDVVLPEGIVGVDEQGLVGGAASDLIGGVHRLIIRRIVVPIRHSQRANNGDATLGGCIPGVGYARVESND